MTLLQRLERLWFPAFPPERLALLRIAVGGYAFWYVFNRIDLIRGVAETTPALFAPIGLASFLSEPLPVALVEWLVLATLGLNVLFILGWRHRVTGPTFAVLLMFVLSYRNSWSMIYHSSNALVLHALVLGLTRSADAFAVDTAPRPIGRSGPEHWRYGWPVMLICFATLLSYFLAGFAKVAGPQGWSWALGDSLRMHVAVDALRKDLLASGGSPLAHLLFQQVWLFTLMGVGTLVLELGAPLVIANRRLGQFWAVNAYLMHWGIYFIMGINFRYCLSAVIFLSFFDPDRIVCPIVDTFRSAVERLRNPRPENAATS